MTTITCVLKMGGDFHPKHVARFCRQVRQWSPLGTRIVCLTDAAGVGGPDEVLRPEPLWPGWFSKLRVFEHRGPILYSDLDVTITGDLSPLLEVARRHDFVMWRAPIDSGSRAGSGLMAWRGDLSAVSAAFSDDPEQHMATYVRRGMWGDQDMIYKHSPVVVEFWQDLLPGMVMSRKTDRRADWSDCRVKLYHGVPRPWEVGE
jgi:hypothetical protein